jgi:hypothetical protein
MGSTGLDGKHANHGKHGGSWRMSPRLWWYVIMTLGLIYLIGFAANLPFGHLGQTELILLVAILVLNPALVEAFVERVRSLSVSTKGIEVSLQEVQRKQGEQTEVLETIAFLLANYLPRAELEYLLKIAGIEHDDRYQLQSGANVRVRLRRLRDAELIYKTDSAPIADLPSTGHLRERFGLTERGRTYLNLVRRVGTPEGSAFVEQDASEEAVDTKPT